MNYCYRNANQVLGANTSCCNNLLSNQGSVLGAQDTCTNDNLLDSLCCCIGKTCSCEFQIHDNLETKTGILEKVASDYLLLRSTNNNKIMFCQTCNLRFVTVTC